MKSWKSHGVFVSSITRFTGRAGPRTMYVVISSVATTVAIKGPVARVRFCSTLSCRWGNQGFVAIQFCDIGCRNGRPAFRTTPAKIYSKQDTKKRVVFSEFRMFACLNLSLGGMYLCR
jgi:hypothetical protein